MAKDEVYCPKIKGDCDHYYNLSDLGEKFYDTICTTINKKETHRKRIKGGHVTLTPDGKKRIPFTSYYEVWRLGNCKHYPVEPKFVKKGSEIVHELHATTESERIRLSKKKVVK